MTEEQINRARAIVSQAKEYENNPDKNITYNDLKDLSSEDMDCLVSGQKIREEIVTESNGLRR